MEEESFDLDIKPDIKPYLCMLNFAIKEEDSKIVNHELSPHHHEEDAEEKSAPIFISASYFRDLKHEIKEEPNAEPLDINANFKDNNYMMGLEGVDYNSHSTSNLNIELERILKIEFGNGLQDTKEGLSYPTPLIPFTDLQEKTQDTPGSKLWFSRQSSKERPCSQFSDESSQFGPKDEPAENFLKENLNHQIKRTAQPENSQYVSKERTRPSSTNHHYRCDDCNKSFSALDLLSIHLKIHLHQGLFICDVCGKFYKLKYFLDKHVISHFKLKDPISYKCDICNMLFSKRSIINRHLKTHIKAADFKCDECGQVFKWKTIWESHKLVHSNNKPYSCNICQATFKHKSSMILHTLKHSGIRPYKCDECGKTFPRKQDLNRHRKQAHVHSLSWEEYLNLHKCRFCDKRFPQKSHLHSHERRVHSDENRPYKCIVCPKRFKKQESLVRHEKLHSPSNPTNRKPRAHKCGVCGSLFLRKSHLIRHEATHSKEKRFQCDVCGKSFKTRESLISHEKRQTCKHLKR